MPNIVAPETLWFPKPGIFSLLRPVTGFDSICLSLDQIHVMTCRYHVINGVMGARYCSVPPCTTPSFFGPTAWVRRLKGQDYYCSLYSNDCYESVFVFVSMPSRHEPCQFDFIRLRFYNSHFDRTRLAYVFCHRIPDVGIVARLDCLGWCSTGQIP